MNLEEFEKSIGYKFNNIELLKTALTHTSYAHEKKIESNEKLEFLGDSILEFISSKYLYTNYKRLREGEMTKIRSSVVCESSLYKIAEKYRVIDYLYLGRSERTSNPNHKTALLADSIEALIAAIYLDSNLEEAEKFIVNNLKDAIEDASKNVGMKDYKTVLQEKLQIHGNVKIEYILIKECGPDHEKTFSIEVRCDGKKLAEGTGFSKKNAEMEAAKKALENLRNK